MYNLLNKSYYKTNLLGLHYIFRGINGLTNEINVYTSPVIKTDTCASVEVEHLQCTVQSTTI